jgi:hypothetical protein
LDLQSPASGQFRIYKEIANMTQKLTAAQAYIQSLPARKPEIVDVTLPSGNVFKFQKPSRFTVLFQFGKLPTAAADQAAHRWIDDGVIENQQAAELPAENREVFESMIRLRDRVLELSHEPRLVMGTADPAQNQLSVDLVSDDDLNYLFQWVAAGGDEGIVLSNFPAGSQSNAVAGNGGPKRRNKAK